jgi:hypothetical protein
VLSSGRIPDLAEFKRTIAMAIVFKRAEKLIRPAFQGFQANITTYTIAMLSRLTGDRFSLDTVWQQQGLSDQLNQQILIWAGEVDVILRNGAGNRIVSEWAKREECWADVSDRALSSINLPIPELSA